MIRLRPHHLLCILGWRGHGYDPVFTANFNRLVEELKTGTNVRLVEGGDDLCESCPKYESPDCQLDGDIESDHSPGAIDSRVISRLNIRIGQVYEINSLFGLIKRKIRPLELADICHGCPWLDRGWCQEALGTGAAP